MFNPSKKLTYAIVGASNNPEKYGYKVLMNLKTKDFSLIPINPHEKEILGLQVFSDLQSCPNPPDVVVFVVPPKVAFDVLQSAHKLGITKFWFQPGSESKEAIEFCKKNNLECIHDSCIMVETK